MQLVITKDSVVIMVMTISGPEDPLVDRAKTLNYVYFLCENTIRVNNGYTVTEDGNFVPPVLTFLE